MPREKEPPSKRLIAVSGGCDSIAMALLAHERGEDFDLLFADTGAELPLLAAAPCSLAINVAKVQRGDPGGVADGHRKATPCTVRAGGGGGITNFD